MVDQLRVSGATKARHEPARLSTNTILRRRLVSLLRGRFDRRLTVIEGGAGFGKSTLLAQAVHENRIEKLGVDALLRVSEADQDPDFFIEGLGDALGVDGPDLTVERLADAVWSKAPESVALIVDDVHRLSDVGEAWDVLEGLLDRLPSNGHLVVSGRRRPCLPVARLLSQDDAIVVGEDDLEFTDEELKFVAELRAVPAALAAELPRWPALATLTGVVGRSESIDYLWEEVLRMLPPERQQLLAAVAPFGEVDDHLVRALGSTVSARDLMEGLPLVDATDDGTFRLHDLWVDALAQGIGVADRNRALRAGGQMLLSRGELGRAAEAFALAGDDEGLEQLIVTFAHRPTLTADTHEINRLNALLPETVRDRPGARYLAAARYFGSDEGQAAEGFRQARDAARESGEVELEMLAQWRLTQFDDLDLPGGAPLPDRVEELAESGVPLARAIRAFVGSRQRQCVGDVEGSLALLNGLADFDPEQREKSVRVRLMDLGRTEAITATLDEVLASGISDVYEALAVWMRGDIDPVDAWPFARLLPERSGSLPLMTATGLRSMVVLMGVMAGAHDEVTVLADHNLRCAHAAARLGELFAQVASGMVELVTVDEETAVATFSALLDDIPIGSWPERPYLYALATIRGLVPGAESLDHCDFGPSLTVAVEAGAALVALRAGDRTPAKELPWTSAALLKVHVPPPLLTELALGAGTTPGAAEVLDSQPHLRTWLRRIVERDDGQLAKRAAAKAKVTPARPPFDLRIGLMGGLSLTRSDGRPSTDWARRERVRHLLAYIALGRDISRYEAAAELWPDLSSDKAAANLRVNLHHLQKALQPDRLADDPPWFLSSDGTRLRLARDGVTVDTELIDAAMVGAVQAESAGLPSDALRHYERVAELAAGDLIPEVDAEWANLDRMRLRSIVYAAASRQGELVLARAEPEAALSIAVRAQRLDPLSERAHRLSIRCHLALGSVSASRAAARLLRETLHEAGIPPEHETELLLARIES